MSITKVSNTVNRSTSILYQLTQINFQAGWRYYTEELNIKVGRIIFFFCQELKDLNWLPTQVNDKDILQLILLNYETRVLVAELTLKSDWGIFWDRRLDLFRTTPKIRSR